MNKTVLLLSTALWCSCLHATDKQDHFPSLKAPDIATAMCNLDSYNEKLRTILAKKELENIDMVQVHELTYTLENAIQRLQTELAFIAAVLEETHKGSEQLNKQRVKGNGKVFLQNAELLLKDYSCAPK